MAFDSSIISFTTKTDKVDLVSAAHINAVQNELVTIETILGTGLKGTATDLSTRLNKALDSDGSLLSGTSYPSPALPSQGFFRTDLDAFFIRNASNTAWLAQGVSLSNVLFQYNGVIVQQEYVGSSLNPNAPTLAYRFLSIQPGGSYGSIWSTKWVKTAGVNTITIYCRIWNRISGSSVTCNLKIEVGSATGNVTGTANQTTPEWKSFTIDVSGLVNLTAYDVTASMYCPTDIGEEVYCSNIVAIGS